MRKIGEIVVFVCLLPLSCFAAENEKTFGDFIDHSWGFKLMGGGFIFLALALLIAKIIAFRRSK